MSMEKKQNYLKEAVEPFNPRTAMEEAARCLLCHDAPCSQACPAGTDPARFIRSIRFRNVKGAAAIIREANILGASCARVCPYDELCQEGCSRSGIDRPIQIGRLQRFATDQEALFNMRPLQAPEATKEKVACIGSGPASLACAAKLAMKGYKVTVFEERDKIGGMLTYGIIPSRLPQEVVEQDVQHVKDLGVEFVLNTKVGRDITIDELRKQGYKAFFIGTGMWTPKMIDIPGADLKGVMTAMDFLPAAKSSNGNVEIGENVIVIGGGDVAMDCAATARLLGAKKVTVVYRRTIEEAPANRAEIQFVQSLGVGFSLQFRPAEIIGKDGKVTAFKAVGVDGESEILLKADQVIFAIGQEPEDVKAIAPVEVTDKKLVATSEEKGYRTNVEDIFAAGDVVNGGKTVVHAVAAGKEAAESIDEYLTSKKEGAK